MIRGHVAHAIRPLLALRSWQIVSLTPCTTHAEADQAIQDLVRKHDPFQQAPRVAVISLHPFTSETWSDPDWDWD